MMTETETPRVWVGCLACYNGGDLVGAWVDAVDGPEYVPDGHEIRCLSCGEKDASTEVLCPARFDRHDGTREHYVGIVGPDGLPHEEQWVMDFEGFGGLLAGECSPAEAARLAEIIDRIDADGIPVEAVAAWLGNTGDTLQEWDSPTSEEFGDAYNGEWDSEEEFAQQLAEDIGAIPDDASWPSACIDWEQATRELFMDYWSADAGGGRVFVFRQ